MTDYPTILEVLAIHHDQIERYGGGQGYGMEDCWKRRCFVPKPVTMPI